jgi:hypothetical protein
MVSVHLERISSWRSFVKNKALEWTARTIAVVLVLAASIGAQGQAGKHMKFSGTINDFTPANTPASVMGPWEVRGHWSLTVNERSRKAYFSAALTMERSDLGVMQSGGGDLDDPKARNAHTHHITLVDGEITKITGGFEVTGKAMITANGIFPPPFGPELPTLTIDITGGTGEGSVIFSNVTLVFSDPAAGHFGLNPLHGVVVRSLDKDDLDRR